MASAPPFVGIDVAKNRLDIAVRPGGECWSATNDADGVTALVTRLHELQPTLVVLEASGGYERPWSTWASRIGGGLGELAGLWLTLAVGCLGYLGHPHGSSALSRGARGAIRSVESGVAA